jgi:hypothetical protein
VLKLDTCGIHVRIGWVHSTAVGVLVACFLAVARDVLLTNNDIFELLRHGAGTLLMEWIDDDIITKL